MSEQISVSGIIATDPRPHTTKEGLSIVSFRLASNSRYFDRAKNEWVSSLTNWFTIVAFRQLADNCSESLSKGDRVLVTGKLKIRDWDNGERSGTSVEIDADAIGLDLSFGTGTLERTVIQPSEEDEFEEELERELQPA
jgi:single-strand DNA-binding protein